FDNFSAMLWMRHFMAGFFIVFAFFKLLNVEGFANSYQMYDIIAARWRAWGYIYPFVELGLGILYLINVAPTFTNWATILVLGVSSIGVIKSNLDRRAIKCACLGDVFNLPMSTVTIVEDLTMVAMAVAMLFL
ncbi:MAG: MauE/DoxX family redox-associated membrane protein, partial [Bacteroidota bacterium]